MSGDTCICFWLDSSQWGDATGFGNYDPASQMEQNPACPVHPIPDEAAHQEIEAEMAAESEAADEAREVGR